MDIDYLVLGHIAHDKTPHGPQLGGTVAYGAAAARAMGLRVGMVTSAHPDDPVLAQLAGITLHLIPAESSTIFVNTYTDAGRIQTIEGHARVLTFGDLPADWRKAAIVHLATIARELDETLIPANFPDSLVGVTPQGLIRTWNEDGLVSTGPWTEAELYLPTAAVTVFSDEDLGMSTALERRYATMASRLVVTRGPLGATLYTQGRRQDFPAPDIKEAKHLTGAGDIFIGTLLAYLHYAPDAWEKAVQVAVTVASVFVEQCEDPGVPGQRCMQHIMADSRVRALL